MLNKDIIRRAILICVAVTAVFTSGYYYGHSRDHTRGSFDDMIVNHPQDLMGLINRQDARVRDLAAELKTPQNAYAYVRDRVRDDAAQPADSPGEIISAGRASCLGKAVLLASLYRALGLPSSAVRVVIGEISIPAGTFDHAWIDMEYNGSDIQQDATNILGTFTFDQFQGDAYTQAYVRDEEFVFNDTHFAVVSQLNQFKNSGHPKMK